MPVEFDPAWEYYDTPKSDEEHPSFTWDYLFAPGKSKDTGFRVGHVQYQGMLDDQRILYDRDDPHRVKMKKCRKCRQLFKPSGKRKYHCSKRCRASYRKPPNRNLTKRFIELWNGGVPVADIQKQLGLGTTTIRMWRLKHGLTKRPICRTSLAEKEPSKIKEFWNLWAAGVPTHVIAKRIGVSRASVQDWKNLLIKWIKESPSNQEIAQRHGFNPSMI